MPLNFRKVLNTISDVVNNRPLPLRKFDQIYMKVGDLVIQADFIAKKYNKLDVVFIGDGDAIGLSIMHLFKKGEFKEAPRHILVLDFDERIVNSINTFAITYGLSRKINAIVYNVCDPLPRVHQNKYDAFYTNPPWGAYNNGNSVIAFIQRGIEAIRPKGEGTIVIGDNKKLKWAEEVLLHTQDMLLHNGFIIKEMIPGLHQYHLDDAPNLTSCCILTRNIKTLPQPTANKPLPQSMVTNFYGRNNHLKYKYIKDLAPKCHGEAHDSTYKLILLEKQT